jgi:hypothetical protein
MQARAAGGHAMGAARDLRGAARHAAYAAGQAGAVAHVAAHELGAAAYAIKAARAAAPEGVREAAARLECRWQRDQLPEASRIRRARPDSRRDTFPEDHVHGPAAGAGALAFVDAGTCSGWGPGSATIRTRLPLN